MFSFFYMLLEDLTVLGSGVLAVKGYSGPKPCKLVSFALGFWQASE